MALLRRPVTVGVPVRSGDGRRLEATLRMGRRRARVRFAASHGPLAAGPEPFLALALPVAMRLGRDLESAAPASPRLLANLPAVARRFRAWDPRLGVPRIRAVAREEPPVDGRRTAAFFSGGVDSFFTLLRHEAAIDDLVFVHGFDLRLADRALRERCAGPLREAARRMGKGWIEVETDLREALDPLVRWDAHLHGAALAAVALLLAPRAVRVLIPGEHFPAEKSPRPRGSHPETDPLFATERVAIVHDGADVTRPQKLARIADHPVVRRTLRVCWENRDDAYNCGRCSKCLRNLAILRALGREGAVTTFARPLDLDRLRALSLELGEWREGMEEALAIARARGGDPALEEALEDLLRRGS